jgi:hypothetical protein
MVLMRFNAIFYTRVRKLNVVRVRTTRIRIVNNRNI